MNIVNTTQPLTAAENELAIARLAARYPFIRTALLTTTAFQRPIRALILGEGPRHVLYTAAHHANEWITALLLLKFAEDWAQAIDQGGNIGDQDAQALAQQVTVYLVPMVNPDGVDLVTGGIQPGDTQYELAMQISQGFPQIPFPDGWKANLLGTDLNLNYPAGWLQARQIKFSQGYIRPAPRDYVGRFPFDQAETRALAAYTALVDPALVLAFHTQGEEIYWQFRDIEIPGAQQLGQRMADAGGYQLTQAAYNSSFAGYKDWFIQRFRRPGYTIEAGSGVNPLPLDQFETIYGQTLPMMLIAATG